MKQKKEVISYLFFGGLTFLVSIGIYWLANQIFHINELLANVISWICAVTFAYGTNRIWVFSSRAKGVTAVLKEMLSFFGGRVATLVIEEIILLIFISMLNGNSMLIKTVAQVIVILLNYIISKFWIFSDRKAVE